MNENQHHYHHQQQQQQQQAHQIYPLTTPSNLVLTYYLPADASNNPVTYSNNQQPYYSIPQSNSGCYVNYSANYQCESAPATECYQPQSVCCPPPPPPPPPLRNDNSQLGNCSFNMECSDQMHQSNNGYYVSNPVFGMNMKRGANNCINTSQTSVPRYIKPKVCKTPIVIHTACSQDIVKPKPQLATLPPERSSQSEFHHDSFTSNNSSGYDYARNCYRYPPQVPVSVPPPPPPPPTYCSSTQYRVANQSQTYSNYPPPPPPKRPLPSHTPPDKSMQTNCYDDYNETNKRTYSPAPPTALPPVPPTCPPQIPHHTRLTTHNMLNTLLTNNLNASSNRFHNTTADYTFNTSLNSSATVYNNSVVNHQNNNNSMLDNHHQTQRNGPNYQQLLNSTSLYTLFDRKKQPPPPYPGVNNQTSNNSQAIQMDTCEATSILRHPPAQLVPTTSSSSNNTSPSKSTTSTNSGGNAVRTCTPQAFKLFMEQHVENVLKQHAARANRREQLETEMVKANLPDCQKTLMRQALRQKETIYLRLRRAKMKKSQFEIIKLLGIGAFGEVSLVRKRDEADPSRSRLYAMKVMHKSEVYKRKQEAHVKAERDILAKADSEWVVKLYYSFQDEDNLYLVMDYVPGGDLMNLLIKFQVFDEKLARFYIGELTCALESVHNLGFIHRDIKPDNILIDRDGHIKLTDFGLCTGFDWSASERSAAHDSSASSNDVKIKDNKRLLAHSLVGTPNYIAPEVLLCKGYTKSCDWWSVGVILYEMVVGRAPFHDEGDNKLATQHRVINWRHTLKVPVECRLSPEVTDLIFKLCTSADVRLGADGIKCHPFFRTFDFGPNLRRSQAPYVPPLKHATDTSNFEIDPTVLAERRAKLEQIRRNQQLQQQYNQQYPQPKGLRGMNQLGNGKSPMMYEYTFRRFFDQAEQHGQHYYPSIDSTEGSENASGKSNSIGGGASLSSSSSIPKPKSSNSQDIPFSNHMNNSCDNTDFMDTSSSQELCSAKSNNSSSSKLDQNSLSYQTQRLIDNTKKIQLRETTNVESSNSNTRIAITGGEKRENECRREENNNRATNPPVYI